MATVLMPLPNVDFDTTEVSVPWRLLTRAGHQVVFATEEGAIAACDPLLLSGVIFGQLGADPEPRLFYAQLLQDPAFRSPLRWQDIRVGDYDALWLAGGHAPGMRQYLGSALLQDKVAEFWALKRPVAAICHGPLLLARATDADGASLLRGRTSTALPSRMELLAWALTAWKLGRYYRTYPETVQAEMTAAIGPQGRFQAGPLTLVARGTDQDDGPAFVVSDDNYLSGRWPGDAYRLARALMEKLPAPASAQ